MKPITLTVSNPRRYKRTSDGEWQTETLQALQEARDAIAVLEAHRTTLLHAARDAGNPVWILAAASGISRSHLYRLLEPKEEIS